MNKKVGFFGRIIRFFDRKVVVPITRFLMKIGKAFSNSNKALESFLSRSNTLLFISLILAVLVFIVIDKRMLLFTSNSAEVLKGREVKAKYNKEMYVVEGLPDKVDITLMGRRSDLFLAKQSNASVSVDLTGYKPGTHRVEINYISPLHSIEYSVNPSVANVNIYNKVSVSKTITADILNQDSLDSKVVVDDVKLSVDTAVVKGTDDENANNSLKKIAAIKALIDVGELKNSESGSVTIKNIPLMAYDKDGNKLDVEIVPSKISADVIVSSPSKTVPIRVIPKGEISFGKAISSIQMSEATVMIYGVQSVLDGVEYVSAPIDVSGINTDKEYKVDLTKPKGVRSMSVSNVSVSLSLGASTDSTVDNVNIDVKNLGDGYTVQGLTENDIKVSVNLKGVENVIKNITAEDITAYIDLMDYKPGEYEVPVKVERTDPRVQYLSKTKKVKIRVVEK